MAAISVDQVNIVTVEGRQVFVMKAGPLAELPVPGFELFCGFRIIHEFIDSGPDLLHLFEVGQFHQFRYLVSRDIETTVIRHGDQVSDDLGPAVPDEVFLDDTARGQCIEVFHPLALPARSERFLPLGVCWSIGTDIDR